MTSWSYILATQATPGPGPHGLVIVSRLVGTASTGWPGNWIFIRASCELGSSSLNLSLQNEPEAAFRYSLNTVNSPERTTLDGCRGGLGRSLTTIRVSVGRQKPGGFLTTTVSTWICTASRTARSNGGLLHRYGTDPCCRQYSLSAAMVVAVKKNRVIPPT